MSKWADYCIFAVRFNSQHTHIDLVRAYPDEGDKFGQMGEYARSDIVDAIKRGITFVTIFKNSQTEKYEKGQSVYIIKVNGTEYLKTVDNGKAADNLDNLPEF
jgi:hypothetical protein